MRQVDLMVDARKQEWLREKRTLQSKLDVREQELVIQKATLSQKLLEVFVNFSVLVLIILKIIVLHS